ncbi:N-6 DNA methylase [Corynebacterium diphtheriae]|uniref:N-6 DNA methylase n=1 Tax=Corynebacterium diphtheriae TaxID=1717 RepID=UPI0002468C2B|nr:N-6 DNA methylase [Corynebacterium diphtheriae]AEX79923.1 putative type I restriction/modification system DNA methylase [Corynebacterium diphtheriae HC03]KJJ59264.1 restriction endonuclease subunit M [Corynebacterium diphtheriae]CAB0762781.1 type I restriction endonuclease subunit M [Corynebacterium diphtheriae]CAB0783356.1 type I restriction endonuclease subunit M [Corynebacterium diphtheriae]CAB0784014.1 type I restriction endonuclease subunit M [Corynebacterium diphtheriae]
MARAKKTQELTLEQVLWNCRVALRSVGSTEKNRDAVISLVFLKFAGDKFAKQREALKTQYGDIPAFLEKPSFYNADNVFYLNESSRWDFLVAHAGANDIAILIDNAMADIEKNNPSLGGALPQGLFATLGASPASIKSLIDEIGKINQQRFPEEDLIGRVYEYFLQSYAAAGTKEDGEFYTPSSIVKLIAEIIEPYKGTVYDPCCGSGGMFVQSMKFIERHHGNKLNISILGQESKADTWRLCKMNLAARGISYDLGEKNASTFTDDQHLDRKVNFIMANPPFNLKGWRGEDELTKDSRWAGYPVVPPVANANYAWILHMISKLDVNDGIAGFLLANGALNAGDDEAKIRKEIIERDLIEAIIVLPRDMFYTTDISVTLWVINMNKKAGRHGDRELRDRTGEILFMDLRRWNENIDIIQIDKNKRKKKVAFTDEQIQQAKDIYNAWQDADRSKYEDVPELCKSASLEGDEGIRARGYTLAPSKYIEFIDHDLDIDYETEMKRIQKEMTKLLQEQRESQAMLEAAFKGIGYDIN